MVIYEFKGQLVFAVFFGLCLIGSFVGYGWLLARVLKIPLDPSPLAETGLYAGWGLSLWIAIGGILVFGSLVSPCSILALLIGGVGLVVYALLKHPYKGAFNRLSSPANLVWLFLIGFALIVYVFHSSNFLYNPNDDMVIYNVFPQQMLQTGTVIDPLSWRRMTAYGGQSFMQAACMSVLPPQYMNLFDRGICALLSFVVLANVIWMKKLEQSGVALLLLGVIILIPSPAVNVTSEESDLFLVLVLVMTCERLYILDINLVKSGLILGLISSAYYALKTQHLTCLVFFFSFLYLYEAIKGKRLIRSIREALLILFFSILFVLPWARVQFISIGTFLYPIFLGNQPSDFGPALLHAPMGWEILWILEVIPTCAPIVISLVAIMMVKETGGIKIIAPLCFAAVAQLLFIAYIMASKTDQDVAIYRYVFGFLISAAFLSLLSALEFSKKCEELAPPNDAATSLNPARFSKRLVAWVSASFILFNIISTDRDLLHIELPGTLDDYSPTQWAAEIIPYRAMQAAVPPGEPILVYTNFPFLFDFQRNPIYVGDIPGGCSPPPHMPFFKGPESLENYLKGLGINHVIHSDFNAPGQIISGKYAFYSRPFWSAMSHSAYPVWRAHAPFFLDMMDNLEAMEKDRNVIQDSDLTLFSLSDKPDQTAR